MSDASDKLAQTRLAIIAHIQRRERPARPSRMEREVEGPDGREAADWDDDPRQRSRSRIGAWYERARRVVSTWWRHHPAHAGVELAAPMLSSFAERRPMTYLGISAVTGAALVLTRPWRLISVTGLVVALLKSSQLSSLVLSAMSGADFGTDDQPPS